MAIGANSYGSVAGVGVLVPRWSGAAGDFADTTRPTATTVEGWIDEVSAILNSVLAQNGFTVPVTQSDALLMLGSFVNEEAAAIVEGINGAGRFGPTGKKPGKQGRFALMLADVEGFIGANARGLEQLGAARPNSITASIAYRSVDESGNATAPLFQREAFGNTFKDWDA